MTTLKYQGKDVVVVEEEVLNAHEPWCEYQLLNGRTIKVRLVLVGVYRSVSVKDSNGDDVYIVQTDQLVKVK